MRKSPKRRKTIRKSKARSKARRKSKRKVRKSKARRKSKRKVRKSKARRKSKRKVRKSKARSKARRKHKVRKSKARRKNKGKSTKRKGELLHKNKIKRPNTAITTLPTSSVFTTTRPTSSSVFTITRPTRLSSLRERDTSLIKQCFRSASYQGHDIESKIDHIPIFYDVEWNGIKFTVMFWNVQGLSSGIDKGWHKMKRDCVKRIIGNNKPDLLFLSEVSYKLVVEFIPNYELIGHSIELKVNDEMGTKDLRLYKKTDSLRDVEDVEVGSRAIRSNDIRSWLETTLTAKNRKQLKILGLHAKASNAGGKGNIEHIMESIKPSDSISYLIGGDFNLNLKDKFIWEGKRPAKTIQEYIKKGWKITEPDITGSVFGGGTQKSGKVLDYVLSSKDVTITKKPLVDLSEQVNRTTLS